MKYEGQKSKLEWENGAQVKNTFFLVPITLRWYIGIKSDEKHVYHYFQVSNVHLNQILFCIVNQLAYVWFWLIMFLKYYQDLPM
jgi:hypothetical protein